MLKSLENRFEKVNFVNLSMAVVGIVGTHSNVTNMFKALGFQQQEIGYSIRFKRLCVAAEEDRTMCFI